MFVTVMGPGPPMRTFTVIVSICVPPSWVAHSGDDPMFTCTDAVGPGDVRDRGAGEHDEVTEAHAIEAVGHRVAVVE